MANDGQIALKITAEEAEALASLGRLVQAEDEAADGLRRMAAESRQSAAEHRALFREADKIKQSMTTPLEDYQKRLARLRQMVAAHALTEEEAARAREQAGAVYVAAVQKEFEASEQGQALAAARAEQLRREEAAARAAAKEEDALAKAAQRVKEAHQSPLDKYTAKLKELDTLLVKHKISQQEHTAAVRAAKLEYDQAAGAGDKAFGSGMLGKVTELAAGFGLATTAVEAARKALGLIKGEMDAIFERQDRAAKASMTEAEAQRDFLVNLGANTPQERDEALAEVDRISAETGVSKRDLYLRASTAVSAKGPLSIAEALEAVKVSADFLPGSPEAGKSLAGAALDLDKILTGRGHQVNAEQTVGYLQAVGQTARVVDPEKLARNVMPAIATAMSTGATEQEAGALWSAFTSAMADPMGEMSRTAAINFSQKLDEFFTAAPKENAKPEEQASWQRRKDVKGFGERMALLRSDEGLREEFLGSNTFEAAAALPVKEIVSGLGAAAQAFDEYVKALPSVENSAGLYRQRLQVMDAAELQQTAAFGRGLDTGIERLETSDQQLARLGLIRNKFQQVVEDTGESRLVGKFNKFFAEARAGTGQGVDAFIDELKALRDRRQQTTLQADTQGYGPSFAVPLTVTPHDEKVAGILSDLIDRLEEANSLSREQLAETKKQTEKLDRPRERGRLGNPDSKQ